MLLPHVALSLLALQPPALYLSLNPSQLHPCSARVRGRAGMVHSIILSFIHSQSGGPAAADSPGHHELAFISTTHGQTPTADY
jgi:hypothetical protein